MEKTIAQELDLFGVAMALNDRETARNVARKIVGLLRGIADLERMVAVSMYVGLCWR